MALIAVIDVETTGLNPHRHDRIIELAIIVQHVDGSVVREFSSLINPERDIGSTRIHGIASRDILSAPRFADIAGRVIEALDGCVAVAGHNVWFDVSFLKAEFSRFGNELPDHPRYCTMRLAGGGTLESACETYGICLDGPQHTALSDARAASRLLNVVLSDAPLVRSEISALAPISWPRTEFAIASPFTRTDADTAEREPPSYLRRLLDGMPPEIPDDPKNAALLAYTALLNRVLEDRHIDEDEGETLVDLVTHWRISPDQVRNTNWSYLMSLFATALADGKVTDSERRDLIQVGRLL
jgi:DNA polymerase-3 subunit epsilon